MILFYSLNQYCLFLLALHTGEGKEIGLQNYFRARGKRGNVKKSLAILKRSGVGVPSQEGDELE